MDTFTELASQLADYLNRRLTFQELEAWVTPRLPIFLDSPDSVTGRIAGAIELTFAEYQAGLKAERTIRSSLKRYLAAQETTWVSSDYLLTEPVTITSTSSTVAVPFLSQLLVWRTERSEATA